MNLDFFIMLSSVITLIGSATQTAYCAASAFQDHFARWRINQGYPACSFAFGLIADIGTAAARSGVSQATARKGLYETSESEFLKLFEGCFFASSTTPVADPGLLFTDYLCIGLDPNRLAAHASNIGSEFDFYWTTDPRHGIVTQAVREVSKQQTQSSPKNDMPNELDELTLFPERVVSTVSRMVVERLAKLLFVATSKIDAGQNIGYYGMDSMVAAELRNWLWKNFTLDISFLELSDPQLRIRDLVDKAVMIFQERTQKS